MDYLLQKMEKAGIITYVSKRSQLKQVEISTYLEDENMPRTKKAAEVAEEIKEKVEEAVVAVEAVAEKKRPGRKKAEGEAAAAKTRAPRAAKAVAPEVFVQFGESETNVSAVVEAAKADFSMNNSGAVTDLKLYIKPEDGMAYYVINGVEGKVAL